MLPQVEGMGSTKFLLVYLGLSIGRGGNAKFFNVYWPLCIHLSSSLESSKIKNIFRCDECNQLLCVDHPTGAPSRSRLASLLAGSLHCPSHSQVWLTSCSSNVLCNSTRSGTACPALSARTCCQNHTLQR